MTLVLQHRGCVGLMRRTTCMVLEREHYTKSTPTPKKSQPRSEGRQWAKIRVRLTTPGTKVSELEASYRAQHPVDQSSTSRFGIRWKSRRFRETKTPPCSSTIAAIRKSIFRTLSFNFFNNIKAHGISGSSSIFWRYASISARQRSKRGSSRFTEKTGGLVVTAELALIDWNGGESVEDRLDTRRGNRHFTSAQSGLAVGQSKTVAPLPGASGMDPREPNPPAVQRHKARPGSVGATARTARLGDWAGAGTAAHTGREPRASRR